MAVPDVVAIPRVLLTTARVNVVIKTCRAILIAALPLTLTSPGGTIAMALVAVIGAYLAYATVPLAPEQRRIAFYMVPCYFIVVGIDLVNGGGIYNVESAFNYLPLIALAPFAHAVKIVRLGRGTFLAVVHVTLWCALAISLTRLVWLQEVRPGGLHLHSIGYAYVVAVWVVVAMSLFGSSNRLLRMAQIAGIAAGCFTVLITESKIALAAMVVGMAAVGIHWAIRHGRWRQMLVIGIALIVPLGIASSLMMAERYAQLRDEILAFIELGSSHGSSLGLRYELAISGMRAFLDNPILGYGFAERMPQVFAHATPGGPDITFLDYVHNDYVTHLLAFGVFGGLFLIAYYVLTWRLVSRLPDEPLRRASYALLIMLAVYMMAEVGFNMDPVTSVMTIVLGVALSRTGRDDEAPAPEQAAPPA